MSDTVMLALISLTGTVISGVIGLLVVRMQLAQRAINQAQSSTLQKIGEVTAASHALINSGEGTRLLADTVILRARAGATGLPADTDRADEADRALAGHEAKQHVADTQGGIGQAAGAASIAAASASLAKPKESDLK
jgi:hypothetical protein